MKRKTKNSHLNSSRASKPEKVYTRDDFRVRPVTKEDNGATSRKDLMKRLLMAILLPFRITQEK